MKDFKLKFFIAVSILCLAASCGGDDDPEASEPAVTLHLTDKGYFDGLLYYKVTSNSTNEVAVVGAESTAVTAVIPSYVIIDGKTFKCTKIEYKAFYKHTKLNTIIIPKTIKEIGDGAFCLSGLTSVTIPNSVTSIKWGTFENCSGLTSVAIPNSVTSIGKTAFYGCYSLTSVTIPNSVTSIGDEAFFACSGLTSINVETGNTKYDSRSNCNAIIETSSNTLIAGCKNTTIPNSVASIGIGAFINCNGLTSITIPNNVTSIYSFAFYACDNLKTVKSEIEKPFEIDAFDSYSLSTATLIVPKGTKSLYQATYGWNEFGNIIEE